MDSTTLKFQTEKRYKAQQGLSLVELMVGLVIGIVLIGGIAQTMLASREAAVTRQSMSTITDNARFLFDFMARDLRMAGRGYCAGADDCESERWPLDGADLEPPLELDAGALTIRYESFDADGDPIFVEAVYALDGNEVQYSRRTNDVLDGSGRFTIPDADAGYSGEPLVAGVLDDPDNPGLIFEFGVYDRTNHTYDYADSITAGNVDDISAIRTTVTFVDLQPWAGQTITVGDQGAISFTVALRNRVARVTQ